jgi:hypothetical protein
MHMFLPLFCVLPDDGDRTSIRNVAIFKMYNFKKWTMDNIKRKYIYSFFERG